MTVDAAMYRSTWMPTWIALTALMASAVADGPPAPGAKWLQATAYAIPKETATEGEGYFSIIEGRKNGSTSARTPTASTPGWSSSTRRPKR